MLSLKPSGSFMTSALSIKTVVQSQKLWNSLSIDVKKIKPFSSFRRHIKNSVIDGYNTIVDS